MIVIRFTDNDTVRIDNFLYQSLTLVDIFTNKFKFISTNRNLFEEEMNG